MIGGTAIKVINTILQYAYVGLLLMCFMLSLGNRPQGSKWGYTLAFVGFALFTVYMTVSAFFAPLSLYLGRCGEGEEGGRGGGKRGKGKGMQS